MNLQEETRNGYTISAKMKQIWAIQMNMAQYLIDICKRNNLKIWADGGTLLGAIRHNGYIPWDDDIDLLMLREDYDKLISLSEIEFKDPYFLQSAYTDKQYYRGHAQLRLRNTAAILPCDINAKFNQGIFIDIFVYDSIPDNEDYEWKQRLDRADKIQSILFPIMHNHPIMHPIALIKRYYYKLYANKLFCEYENLFRYYKFHENERIACPAFARNLLKIATKQKEWYRETIWVDFEDMKMPVPIDYDKVLSTQYGDYMKPSKAPSMHGEVIFDTEHSYKELLPKLRHKYNKSIWQRIYDKFFKR